MATEFNLIHISTGDLLREEVDKKSVIGKKVAQLIQEGKMAPTELILRILRMKIEEHRNAPGILIDGFPRSMDQALEFESTVGICRKVLAFSCSLQVLEERLIERGKTSGRADDNISTIKKRFDTFDEQSKPVIEYYKSTGKCIEISSEQSIDDVYEQSRLIIQKNQNLTILFSDKTIVFVLGGPGSGKGSMTM